MKIQRGPLRGGFVSAAITSSGARRRRLLTPAGRALFVLLALLGPMSPDAASAAENEGNGAGPSDSARALQPTAANTLATQAAPVGAPMLSIEGKGFGHGRGMGQWGALGYSTAWRIPYPVVLNHYYGGTQAGYVDTSRDIRVRLGRFDDRPFVVAADAGNLVTNITGAERYRTVLIVPEKDGRWTVWAGSDCAGTWGWWFVGASTAPVRFWVEGSRADAQDRSQWFALCTDEGLRYYRGVGETVRTPIGARVLNQLPVEHYVRGVVPREMPASWGDRAWPWGIQALAVQAVAARSYGYTEDRAPGFWNTCDSAACQVYGGAATWDPVFGGRLLEDARSDEAVLNTIGEVRLQADGSVARTEYSASTGGFTAGGTFPPVLDQGDPLPDNPNYAWHYDVSAKALQDQFPSIGKLTKITVTGRNGLGQWGGRVTEVRLEGTTGVAYTDGDSVGYYLGLGTDWFDVSGLKPA